MYTGKIVTVTLSKFIANDKGIARFVKGEVVQETEKAIKLINVTTVVRPHVACCHCNTTLTNPISRKLGVGPVCIVKYGPSMWGVNVTATEFDKLTDADIKRMIKKIEGVVMAKEMWVPKRGGVEIIGDAPKRAQAPLALPTRKPAVEIAGAAFTF